jgi:1-aminocyclopropane-1-carboxylate deaminase
VGIIRGEEPAQKSDTLLQAAAFGMQLIYVSREAFKEKEQLIKSFEDENYYWVNEGGYSRLGAEGAADICSWIDESYTDIICAVGTGTMMAGLIIGAKPHQKVTGISVLKGNEKLIESVRDLLTDEEKKKHFEWMEGYHFGGYAKHPEELLDWMNFFYNQSKVPTDLVYTAKLCFAVNDLLNKGYFVPDSKIMIIHSGGLQGNHSLPAGRLDF